MKIRIVYKGPLYASPQVLVEIEGDPDHVDDTRKALQDFHEKKGWREM